MIGQLQLSIDQLTFSGRFVRQFDSRTLSQMYMGANFRYLVNGSTAEVRGKTAAHAMLGRFGARQDTRMQRSFSCYRVRLCIQNNVLQ